MQKRTSVGRKPSPQPVPRPISTAAQMLQYAQPGLPTDQWQQIAFATGTLQSGNAQMIPLSIALFRAADGRIIELKSAEPPPQLDLGLFGNSRSFMPGIQTAAISLAQLNTLLSTLPGFDNQSGPGMSRVNFLSMVWSSGLQSRGFPEGMPLWVSVSGNTGMAAVAIHSAMTGKLLLFMQMPGLIRLPVAAIGGWSVALKFILLAVALLVLLIAIAAIAPTPPGVTMLAAIAASAGAVIAFLAAMIAYISAVMWILNELIAGMPGGAAGNPKLAARAKKLKTLLDNLQKDLDTARDDKNPQQQAKDLEKAANDAKAALDEANGLKDDLKAEGAIDDDGAKEIEKGIAGGKEGMDKLKGK